MTAGMGYALAAMLCNGLGDLIYKRAAAAGVPAHHFMMTQAWVFCPLVVVYAWITGKLVIIPAGLWGALAAFFLFFGFYQFVKSLAAGAVSINAPIFRLNFALTALLAITLLGEPLTLAKAIGLALAFAAVWLLLGGVGGRDIALKTQLRPLARILVATVAVGCASFFHKLGLQAGAAPATLLASQAVVFSTLATLWVYFTDGGVRPLRYRWGYSTVAAVLVVLAFLFLLESLVDGEASVFVPVAQMGFVITALLGIVVFREAFSLRKILGLAAALAALAAFAIS